MYFSLHRTNPIIQAAIGIAIAAALILIPFSVTQLLGAVFLVLLPGYWAFQSLGFRAPITSPFTWAAAFLTSLIIIPLAVNIAGLLFGLNIPSVVITLSALTFLAAFLSTLATSKQPLIEGEVSKRACGVLLALSLFLALFVVMTFIPIMTRKGLPPVTIGDWDKHGALIWTLADSGVPPEDIFLGATPEHPLAYYYFFHLLAALFHILTHQSLDFRWIFIIPSAALAFSFPFLLFALAHSFFKKNTRAALVSTFFTILVGGLDFIAIWMSLHHEGKPVLSLSSWLDYLHVERWAPPTGLQLNIFIDYFVWVPHHLAALALLVVAWFLWVRRPQWRFLRFWFPLIFASLAGFSVYVALGAFAGLVVWGLWEIGLSLLRKEEAWPSNWRVLSVRGIWLLGTTTLLALPMLWLYWQGRTPGRGVAFATPSLAIETFWPALKQIPFNGGHLHIVSFILEYLLEFGIGFFLLIFGIYITVRAYRSTSWGQNQLLKTILRTSAWRWMFSTGITALLLITFFESSGARPDAGYYGTLNDFGMRVVMPLQIVLGILAGMFILWWKQTPKPSRYFWGVVIFATLLIVPGLLATGWEMGTMAFARYKRGWPFDKSLLQALSYVRTNTPPDMTLQLSVDSPSELYLLARRKPSLWGRTAPLVSSNQPRGYQLVRVFKEAFETEDPERSARLFAENNVDLILVKPMDRVPHAHPEKFKNTDFFHLVFDNGSVQLYQVVKKAPLSTFLTLAARAADAREAGDFEKARELYAQAVAQETDPGMREDILMQWAIMERFQNPEAAVPLFRQLIAMDPHNTEAHANLGAILVNLGQNDEAITELTYVINNSPEHYWAWRLLGNAYEKENNWIKALDAYHHAAEVAKPHTKDQSIVVLGMISSASQGGDCEQARSIAQQYATLLEEQHEDLSSVLASCQ